MSIAAIIEGVARMSDGTDRLALGPISRYDGPGQSVLHVTNPPKDFSDWQRWIGATIWGPNSRILNGELEWAIRLSYLEIELREGALQQQPIYQEAPQLP